MRFGSLHCDLGQIESAIRACCDEEERHREIENERRRRRRTNLFVSGDVVSETVLADEGVHGVVAVHDADETRVVGERNDCVLDDAHRSDDVGDEDGVDESKELHHTFVHSQILSPLEQEFVAVAIVSAHDERTWSLLGGEDREVVIEAHQTYAVLDKSGGDGLSSAGDSHLIVLLVIENWRVVGEFDGGEVGTAAHVSPDLLVDGPGILEVRLVLILRVLLRIQMRE